MSVGIFSTDGWAETTEDKIDTARSEMFRKSSFPLGYSSCVEKRNPGQTGGLKSRGLMNRSGLGTPNLCPQTKNTTPGLSVFSVSFDASRNYYTLTPYFQFRFIQSLVKVYKTVTILQCLTYSTICRLVNVHAVMLQLIHR